MLKSVEAIIGRFQSMRNAEEFHLLMEKMDKQYNQLCKGQSDPKYNIELDPLSLPRKRFIQQYTAHHPETVDDHFRVIYFMFIDSVTTQLKDRFKHPDLDVASKLEKVMFPPAGSEKLPSNSVDDLVSYDDVSFEEVKTEMRFIHRHAENKKYKKLCTVNDVGEFLGMLDKCSQDLYPQVMKLVRLLLVSPASSAEAERSFSSLRRLKTWLRSTMGQERLNSLALCQTHHDILDNIDTDQLIEQFIVSNDRRKYVFGS